MAARWLALVGWAVVAAACTSGSGSTGSSGATDPPASSTTSTTGPTATATGSLSSVIPVPRSVEPGEGRFLLATDVGVDAEPEAAGDAEATLRRRLTETWGIDLAGGPEAGRTIRFAAADALADEGYRLSVTPDAVVIGAAGAAGFGWGVQTLLQLLGERPTAPDPATAIAIPAGTIDDAPRYEWRGVMLDVARHFFGPETVMAAVDLAASYKINRFHLHLSDDQGWRIEIDAHPELTEIGGASEVGGGDGGYFTKEDYAQIVEHAESLGVVVVPEIDMPGHVNAALVSLPALNCDGRAPEPRTDMAVGYSSLCVDDEATYRWVDDVISEVAEMTPGPWIHIGGDESNATSAEDYAEFVPRALAIVRDHAKQPVGWEEIGAVPSAEPPLVQHWLSSDVALDAAARGSEVVMSPAPRTYLDMKYDESSPFGNSWAGFIDTRQAYDWDPDQQVPGLAAEQVVGVEAPLWTEFIETPEHIELMWLPRMPALAEVAWSAPEVRGWTAFQERVQAHTGWWDAAGLAWTDDPAIEP